MLVHHLLRTRVLSNMCRCRSQLRFGQPVRHIQEGDYTPTRIQMLSESENPNIFIKSYNQMGITLNDGIRIVGPCVVFPRSVLHWNVKDVQSLNTDAFSFFFMLDPKPELLLIGAGLSKDEIKESILLSLKQKSINTEVFTTEKAISIFNTLNAEGRFVATALFPAGDKPKIEKGIKNWINPQDHGEIRNKSEAMRKLKNS